MRPSQPSLREASLPEGALRVLGALEAAGHEAWVVGGWVRDALLGRPSADVDVATSATVGESAAALAVAGIPAAPTGVAHGTVSALVADEAERGATRATASEARRAVGREVVEVTTYRVDGPYLDGRHPSSVRFVRSITEDLARRDLTINAMAWHPERGLLDPFGGEEDLVAGLVRAVGDAAARFGEDALRILRAVRLAARLRFAIEPATQRALRRLAPTLARVAPERIGAELRGILAAGRGGWPLREEREALFAAIPELAPMEGFDQRSPYHDLDVLDHVCRVMDFTEVFTGGAASEELRWCALLHDVGKPETLWVDERGQGHFYGHPARGMEMADGILRRLALPVALRRRVVALVRLHDRPVAPTRASVLSILADLDELVPGEAPRLVGELMVIKRADAMAKAPAYRSYALEVADLDKLARHLLAEGAPYRVGDLAVGGGALMAALGEPPGPWVGQTLRALLAAVMEGSLPNEPQALLAAARDRLGR